MTLPTHNRLELASVAHQPTVGKWRTEAMRSHSSPRLIFVSRGQGRITVSGLTSGYTANNLIFIPAGTMYGYELGPTSFCQILTIPMAMATEWPDEPVHLRLRDVLAQKELALHLDALERELKSEQAGHQRAAHYQLGLLSIFFERQLDARAGDVRDTRSETPSARLVAAFTDLIERDLAKPLSIADYAARLGVTPTHLTRCCKQTSGKSALTLLNDRILFEARIRLRDSKTPIQTIAADLGFASAAYFTRAFQSKTGETPSAFRKKGQLATR